MKIDVIPQLKELRQNKQLAVSPYTILQYLGLAIKKHGIEIVTSSDEYKDLRELHYGAMLLFGFAKISGKFNRWLRPGDDPPDVIVGEDENEDGKKITLIKVELKTISYRDPAIKDIANKIFELVKNKHYSQGTVLLCPLDIETEISLSHVYSKLKDKHEAIREAGISQIWLIMKIGRIKHKYLICEVFPHRQYIPDLTDEFAEMGISQDARVSIGNYYRTTIPILPYT